MKKRTFAPIAVLALIAAAPAPTPAPSASPAGRTLSVVCQRAPLFVFLNGTDRPVRAHTAAAMLGQRFGLVSGPRTTLESAQFYETDIAVVEPGYAPNAHYWISRECAFPGE